MKNRNSAFARVLEQLFKAEELPIPLVFRLSDMTPEEWDQFAAAWPIVDTERRRVITRHMADLSEENFEVEFSPVFRLCLEDDNSDVRLAALDGLWDTTNTTVVPSIIALMNYDPKVEVRQAAASTLGHFVLLGEWGQIPARNRDRIVDALLARHKAADTALAVRRATLESLAASSHPDVPGLITAAFESADSGMQLSAVFAMGQSADPQWLPTVLDEMINPWEDMRAEAARAAGELGGSDAVDRLAELAYDESYDVRLAAVFALGKIGGERVSRILTEMLEDPDMGDLTEEIEETLEEMDWLNSDVDLRLFNWDADDLDD